MNDTNREAAGPIRLRRYAWTLIGLWTLAVGAMLTWELIDEHHQALEIARGEARGAFQKDLLFRRWGASHGGVYVPVTDHTPPNPYLREPPQRDVTTQSGQRLTLVNPAYMMRQVNELTPGQDGLRGHLTSLNPLRPENEPDPWEREALEAFQGGEESEVSSLAPINGDTYMRLMRPVLTEPSCLKCHAEQGYRVGDVRGGISVSVPMASVWPLQSKEMIRAAVSYGTLWLLGLGGIVVGSRRLRRHIDYRQRAEEMLRESQRQARETAAHIPGVVYQFLWSPDGTYTFPYVSEGIDQILGMTPEEVRQNPKGLFPGLLFQEELDPIFQSIAESAEKMTTWRRELQVKSTLGEIKWIRATSSPHALPDGSVLFNGVFLDVTERKEAERKLQEANETLELRVGQRTAELEEANRELHKEIADRKQAERWLLESEERFRSYFELGLVGMAITSPEKDWVEVNHRLCEMLGYSEHELLEKTWAEVTHADDLAADETQFNRVLAGVMNGYSMDKRFLRKDGQIVYANLSVRCLRRPDGTVDHLVALVQDITDRIGAEQSLRQSEATYREIFNAANDAIFVHDVDTGAIVDANRATCEMFGYTVEECRKLNVESLSSGEPPYDQEHALQWIRKAAEGEPQIIQWLARHKDGRLFWIEVSLRRAAIAGTDRMLAIVRDISERKRAEEEIRTAQ